MYRLLTLISLLVISIGIQAGGFNRTMNQRSPLLPDHAKVQFAGNIGLLAAGFGYESFGGRLHSDLLVGYLPEIVGKATVITIAQKNTFNFRNFGYKPIRRFNITAGFSVNVESGKNSFVKLPEFYPDGYYSTNAIMFGLFTGIKYAGNYNPKSTIKQIEYFAEVGTMATYLYYVIYNEDYFEDDIYSLALGINMKF